MNKSKSFHLTVLNFHNCQITSELKKYTVQNSKNKKMRKEKSTYRHRSDTKICPTPGSHLQFYYLKSFTHIS